MNQEAFQDLAKCCLSGPYIIYPQILEVYAIILEYHGLINAKKGMGKSQRRLLLQ